MYRTLSIFNFYGFLTDALIFLIRNQWWANPNPDLDLNPDLATFGKSGGFGFGLDLNFLQWWIWICAFLEERIWI